MKPSVIRARCSAPDEWVAEIVRDRDIVERKIARVTKTARPVMDGAVTRAHVVATTIVKDRIILLETCIGELWGMTSDEDVQQRASRIARELKTELHDAGLQVLGGIWARPRPDGARNHAALTRNPLPANTVPFWQEMTAKTVVHR